MVGDKIKPPLSDRWWQNISLYSQGLAKQAFDKSLGGVGFQYMQGKPRSMRQPTVHVWAMAKGQLNVLPKLSVR